MSQAIFKGSTELLEQPKRRTWSAESGWSTVRTWVGPKEATEAWAFTLSTTQGVSQVESSDDGASGTVSATYPDAQLGGGNQTNDALNVVWELLGNDLEKDLRTHSSIFDDVTNTDDDRKQLSEAKKAVDEATELKAEWYDGAKRYYQLLSFGVTGYVVSQWVVKKTIKVGIGSDVKAAVTGVNKVEPPEFNDDIVKLFNLPTEMGDPEQGALQWLKKTPRVIHLGKGKYSIEQEWWGAEQWSNILYGGGATP